MSVSTEELIAVIKKFFPDAVKIFALEDGGQKEVFCVEFESTPNLIFKLIRVGKDDEFSTYHVKRAERELSILKEIDNNGVVKIDNRFNFQLIKIGKWHYIAYAEEELKKLNKGEYLKKIANCKKLIKDVSTTLSFIQVEHGVIHRDIKPANLMKRNNSNDHVLIDFGLASVDGLSRITDGSVGTKFYMSPEQFNDTHSVDLRTDMFSLGITSYELFVGRHPFIDSKDIEQAIKFEPIPFGDEFLEAPEEFKVFIQRLTQKEPHQRFKSYEILLSELDKF